MSTPPTSRSRSGCQFSLFFASDVRGVWDKEVFKGSLWECELVKGLLNDRGIRATIKDGLVVNVALPETAISVKVLVNEADFEPAMDVIRERSKQTLGE